MDKKKPKDYVEIGVEGEDYYRIKDILKKLREEKKLTKDELAEHVMVTRQAVSRWETGGDTTN